MENESNCKQRDSAPMVSSPSTVRSSNSNNSSRHSRSVSGSQHVYLSLTPTETSQESQRLALLRQVHGSREDVITVSPRNASTFYGSSSSHQGAGVIHNGDKENPRRPKNSMPQRELREVDISLRDSAQSYIEASNLLSNERDSFRNCALELLWEMDKTADPILYEQGAEILKCGILLKKASGNVFRRWKEKFVIVTYGHLIWFPIDPAGVGNGSVAITDKMRKNQHEMILDENTEPRCSLSRKKNVNHVFDVIHKVTETQPLTLESVEQLRQYIQSCYSSSDSSSSHLTTTLPISVSDESAIEKHFMCQSDEERDSWLRILRHARLGRDNDPSAWFSQHVFNSVQGLAHKAKTTQDIVCILNLIAEKSIPLCIPIHFIQRFIKTTIPSSEDPQLNQVMKDLNRETVILGERSFQATLGDGDTYGFSSKIMFLLMESIRRIDPDLKSMDLLRITRKALLHTYRTQTGGDCYDAISTLLSQSTLIMIMHDKMPSSKNPITITVQNSLPMIRANVNKEGPYVLSSIDNYFVITDLSKNPLFGVKATVNSVISKDNKDDPWTLKLVFSRK